MIAILFPLKFENGKTSTANYVSTLHQYIIEALESESENFGFDRNFGENLRSLLFNSDYNFIAQRAHDIMNELFKSIPGVEFNDLKIQRNGRAWLFEISYKLLKTNQLNTLNYTPDLSN